MTIMARFYQGKPVMVDYTPSQAVNAGDVVAQADTPFVAHSDIAANALGSLAARGGVYLGLADGAINAGAKVWWDATAHKFTLTQTGGNLHFGTAVNTTALNGDTIYVIHHPEPASLTPATVTFSPAQGAANISLVTMQVKDASGNNITAPTTLVVTLSDAATGAGLTATTASGAVAAGTAGADLGDLTAKKAKVVQTDATGKYILSITDTAKTGFYVTANIPGRKVNVSAALITGNYG